MFYVLPPLSSSTDLEFAQLTTFWQKLQLIEDLQRIQLMKTKHTLCTCTFIWRYIWQYLIHGKDLLCHSCISCPAVVLQEALSVHRQLNSCVVPFQLSLDALPLQFLWWLSTRWGLHSHQKKYLPNSPLASCSFPLQKELGGFGNAGFFFSYFHFCQSSLTS